MTLDPLFVIYIHHNIRTSFHLLPSKAYFALPSQKNVKIQTPTFIEETNISSISYQNGNHDFLPISFIPDIVISSDVVAYGTITRLALIHKDDAPAHQEADGSRVQVSTPEIATRPPNIDIDDGRKYLECQQSWLAMS